MTTTAILTFDVVAFRLQIPAYSDPVEFPDATLQSFWDAATYYMSNVGNFGSLQGDARQYVQVPLKNQWGWWMQISGYGQQLWALLQVKSVGGFYIGGTPTMSAFRGNRYSGDTV
jgi:hypothetical protein